jgi:hypothetical protein
MPAGELVKVRIHRAQGSLARRTELDGFAGAMARFRNAYDSINEATSSGAPDPLILAMQTGDRLGYHPETALVEISQRKQAFIKAVAWVQAMVTIADSDEKVAALLKTQNVKVEDSKDKIARYRMLIHRALTQVQDAQ